MSAGSSKKSRNLAIVASGNIFIGYKFIGPFTMECAMNFCKEMKKKRDPEMSHAELAIIPLYSSDEAEQEIKERGHLMSQQWLCIPRKRKKS